jgi:hypothetical protein
MRKQCGFWRRSSRRSSHLDERQRRQLMGAEAVRWGMAVIVQTIAATTTRTTLWP